MGDVDLDLAVFDVSALSPARSHVMARGLAGELSITRDQLVASSATGPLTRGPSAAPLLRSGLPEVIYCSVDTVWPKRNVAVKACTHHWYYTMGFCMLQLQIENQAVRLTSILPGHLYPAVARKASVDSSLKNNFYQKKIE